MANFKKAWFWVFVWIVLAGANGCKMSNGKADEQPLARVEDAFLYRSDLSGLVRKGMSPQDSTQLVKLYVENWVKKTLLQQEARAKVGRDKSLGERVEAYRAELELLYYEEALIKERLDSTITAAEIADFYEKTKSLNVLKTDVVQCYFLQIPSNAPNIKELKNWWAAGSEDDWRKVAAYGKRYAQVCLMDDSTWFETESLAANFPEGSFKSNQFREGLRVEKEANGFVFLLKVLAFRRRGADAPMGYLKEKATAYILHQRKLELVKVAANEALEKGLSKGDAEIFDKK